MKTSLSIAAASAIFAVMALQASSASAAPVNLAGMSAAKGGTELIEVRGGRGGGFRRGGGGFRRGGLGFRRGGFGFRHGFRHHRRWRGRHIAIGFVGGYAGSGCGYYFHRWQNSGSYHWKAKYYACLGY